LIPWQTNTRHTGSPIASLFFVIGRWLKTVHVKPTKQKMQISEFYQRNFDQLTLELRLRISFHAEANVNLPLAVAVQTTSS
jgi:hypothetical protein